jgi:hypothetical protein
MKKLLKNNLKKIGLICFILICISCEKENKYAKPNKNIQQEKADNNDSFQDAIYKVANQLRQKG